MFINCFEFPKFRYCYFTYYMGLYKMHRRTIRFGWLLRRINGKLHDNSLNLNCFRLHSFIIFYHASIPINRCSLPFSPIVLCCSSRYVTFVCMVGALVGRSTAALRVAASIPAWKKYLYDLHFVLLDLAVCVCEFKYL